MQTVSAYNATKKFPYQMRESRLKKCAKLIERLPPGNMLDIGCSSGDWCAHWQERGWRCSGLDIDREHIAIAKERNIDARFCDLNRDSFPFDPGAFDLIFAGEVIEHLVDTDGFIAELHRCLHPGGHALITTPNLVSFENRIRVLLGIYPAWLNYNLSGSGHVRGYSPRVLKKQLREHGFTIVAHKGNWVPFIPQRFVHDIGWPWLSVTGDIWPNLSMDIMILARKSH